MENENVDYAEMYRQMVRAAESAIRILVEAQRKCEEMYIRAGTPAPPIDLNEYRKEH